MFYILLLNVICSICASTNSASDWQEILFNKMYQDIKPYQITVFTNDTFVKNYSDIHVFLGGIPKLTIDLFTAHNNANQSLLNLSVLKYPRNSNLFIILEHDDNDFVFEKMRSILNYFVQLSPVPTKPKCLLLLFSDNILFQNYSGKILQYAWNLKFLDFTILKIQENNNSSMFSYNPFSNIYDQKVLEWDTVIFPDKLYNMHQYPFKTPLIHFPPSVNVVHNTKERKTRDVTGSQYPFFDIFSKTVNCRLDFLLGDPRVTSLKVDKDFAMILKYLENNDINGFMIGSTIRNLFPNRSITMGRIYHENQVLVVPIIKILRVNIPENMLIIDVTLFSLILIIFYVVTYILKFPRTGWEAIYIFQNLIGMATPRKPRDSVERIIHCLIAFLSIQYTTDIFTEFTELKIVQGEVPFDTFDEIVKYNLTLQLNSAYVPVMQIYDDKAIQTLMSRAEIVNSFDDCVAGIMKTKKTVTMGPFMLMNYLIKKYRNADGSPSMKVLTTPLYTGFRAFVFERASPYVEKFDSIYQRIIESGIPKSHHPLWAYDRYQNSEDSVGKTEETKDMTLTGLLVILSVGFCNSIVAFLVEWAFNAWQKFNVTAKLRGLYAKFSKIKVFKKM